MSVEKISNDGSIPSEFFVLDFEAAGLNMAWSYPIEVGYCNGSVEYEALIKPYPGWDYWSVESQEIHNISQHEIMFSGLDGADVCARMNKDLAGQVVYVDGGMYDQIWCERLFSEANALMNFQLSFVPVPIMKELVKFKRDRIVAHRALADAKEIWKFIDDYQQQ